MGLIQADLCLDWCVSERLTIIDGAQRSGKTLLAFEIARELIQCQKYDFRYLITNVDSDISDSMMDVVLRDGQFLDAVIILDEIGRYINKKNFLASLMLQSDLGKLNCCVLGPSRTEVHKDLQRHVIQPAANLQVLGIDAIIYKDWLDRKSSKSKSTFTFMNTKEMMGHYDTTQMIDNDGGILEWYQRVSKQVELKLKEKKQMDTVKFVSVSSDD